ncbi:MAG TPA: zinc ABC transporter substrate-binding protein [Candidatus Babeliales bacterium]|jgi:manganese/zinc/iron transport system substrate-binding protein|nr:zinc ABC transporter substrate-binding protein [Candidatus Babeliales bacterium]
MNVKRNSILLFAVLLFICFLRVLFIDKNYVDQQKKLTIVVTTSMLADAVRNIVGNNIIVYGLMGPGVDPHLYRARESDVHKLAAADMVIYNGLHLEGKMGQVLEGMQRFTTVVNASQALHKEQLRSTEFDDLYDPHIWFDVLMWIDVVRYMQQKIIALDSENVDMYCKNGDDYIAQLQQLHAYVQNRVNEIDPYKKILITAHDAFGYFDARYGFQVVGLQGLSTDCDISTRDIQHLADFIVEKRIPTIFVESSIPQRALVAVQNAVHARGWNVQLGAELYSDALGDEQSGASSYLAMVKYNVDVIIDSLK